MKRNIRVAICALIIILGIIGSYMVSTNALSINKGPGGQPGNGNLQQPPENSSNNSSQVSTSNGSMATPPNGSGNGTMPQGQNGPGNGLMSIVNYLILFVCNLAISAGVITLATTRLGRISLKEAMGEHKIIFIIICLVLAVALFGLSIFASSFFKPSGPM